MKRMPQTAAASLSIAFLLAAFGAAAQHHKPVHPDSAPAAAHRAPVPGPFSFSVYGAFERMMQGQDFAPKVQLKTVMHDGATDAVGAASGLRGEITALDGTLLVTYGAPCGHCGHADEGSATLLATAKVSAWHEPVRLPADLAGPALDDFIVAQAKKAGLDVSKPFPIRMNGTLSGVKMHVLRGPSGHPKRHGSGHAAGHGAADQTDVTAESIEGAVVGFYAPPPLQGIVTHPGDPFHFHWVDTGRTKTAHLDTFGMRAGAELLLPAK
ncbi:MAG: acetolactate decarboxylase [Pseudorhodoplanes sp.]